MIDVTCAIIVREGKILLAQNRADSDHPLQWEFPGGKIQPGENAVECIRREIQEELEIEIEVLRELCSVEFDYGHKQIRLLPFLCKIIRGEIRLNDHESIAWLLPDEIFAANLSAADRALLKIESNFETLKKYSWKQMDKA